MHLCLENFEAFNGAPIRREQAFCPIILPNKVNYFIDQVDPFVLDKPLNIFYSDAGKEAAFYYRSGDIVLANEYLFTPEEQEFSSSYRELCAVRLAFDEDFEFFESNRNSVILWVTDNKCVVSYLTKGSRIPRIQKMCLLIKKAELRAQVIIIPKWVSRLDPNLVIADIGSKLVSSSDEFGLSHEFYKLIEDKFQISFTVDAFAAYNNRRTDRFFSCIPQREAEGVNFFLQNLKSSEIYYLHPPPSMLRKVFNKIIMYKDITCVVVLPCWASHNFWSFLVCQGFFQSFVKDYLLFDPVYRPFSRTTMFRGKMNFYTLALLIVTGEQNKIPCPDIEKKN